MPRCCMREGGASTKRQCLRSTSISISQCGFSKVDFRIAPVTVNDLDVSYPPQPWWAIAAPGARIAASDRNKRRVIDAIGCLRQYQEQYLSAPELIARFA